MDPKRPGIPHCETLSSNAVTILWAKPKDDTIQIKRYEVHYKIVGKKKWSSVKTEDNSNVFSIEGLKSNTIYEFRVRAQFDDVDDDDDDGDDNSFSDPSQHITTTQSPSAAILKTLIKEKHDENEVIKLPLKTEKDSINTEAKSRKCVFVSGDRPPPFPGDKTIMLMGETGTGKSTLINGMVNYIMGVQYEDDWRFDIIDLAEEEAIKQKDQTTSQTEWITCYTICAREGGQLDYTLDIIDTPGFGDTRGIARDKAIVQQITDLFNTKGKKGIQDLDAVCFVVKASDLRLTASQKYIFDQVLSIFGKDIENNIFILATHADSKNAKVTEALKAAHVPFKMYFPFNNSALFSKEKTTLDLEHWKISKVNYDGFFRYLRQTQTCSLQQSAHVLKTRKNLEVKIRAMQLEIQKEMEMIENINELEKTIRKHESDINANKDFTYEQDVHESIKVDLKPREHVTNCLTCHMTCHYPCAIPDSKAKRGCAAMNGDNCTICTLKCHWELHINDTYRVDYRVVKVQKESKELKERFHEAQGEVEIHSAMLKELKKEQNEHKEQLYSMTQDARELINELNNIALKHNPISAVEYLKLLIAGEKKTSKTRISTAN